MIVLYSTGLNGSSFSSFCFPSVSQLYCLCLFTMLCCCSLSFPVSCRDDLIDMYLLVCHEEHFLSSQLWKFMACCSPLHPIDGTSFFRTPNSKELSMGPLLVIALESLWETPCLKKTISVCRGAWVQVLYNKVLIHFKNK